MPELTIAATGVRALLEFAESKGASRQSLLERSGMSADELAERDGRVAFSKYKALMKAAQTLCNDPALALHFGEEVDFSAVSISGSIGGVRNIEEAFAQLNRYTRLGVEVETVGKGDRFAFRHDAGQLWIVDSRGNPNDFPELTESTFVRMASIARRGLGERQLFKAVHFTHREPAYRAEYERIFRAPLVFGSDKNALQIDEALLSSFRAPPPSPYVDGVLRDHADALLKTLESSQSTRERIESVLTPILAGGDVSVDAVARALGVSRQTLYRKLHAEGVTFQQVLDERRHRVALHYLSAEKASVKRTARLVGFSDSAGFSRAFKRWTGISPRRYGSR